jgi:hypothetical protein
MKCWQDTKQNNFTYYKGDKVIYRIIALIFILLYIKYIVRFYPLSAVVLLEIKYLLYFAICIL